MLNELESLRVALPEEETLLLLDETPTPSVARGLFGRLRDELWELPITWCVAADARDRAAYVEAPADAFWRRVLTLPPLTPAQARELLRARATEIELPEEALAVAVSEAHGNPRDLITLAHATAVEGKDPSGAA